MRSTLLALLAVLPFALGAAHGAEGQADSAAFVFGGRYHTENMEDLLTFAGPFGVDYEDNYVIGAGYQQFFLEGNDFRLGVEAGIAVRMGNNVSGEAWAGAVGRYDGWVIGDSVRISPAFTFGLSTITNKMDGVEGVRADSHGSDARPLFYLGPEINLSWADNPNTEVFFRVQHRSGAWGTLSNMGDGANASTVGMRWHW